MKRIGIAAAAAFLPVLILQGTHAQQPRVREKPDLTGLWHLTLREFGQTSFEARAELKSVSSEVSGTAAPGAWNELKFEGSMEHGVVTLRATRRGRPFAVFTGQLHGDAISGTGTDGQTTFEWSARRMDTPPATARIHSFSPTTFHRVFSARVEPVLRIWSGDSVRTWTVDAGGRDANGRSAITPRQSSDGAVLRRRSYAW